MHWAQILPYVIFGALLGWLLYEHLREVRRLRQLVDKLIVECRKARACARRMWVDNTTIEHRVKWETTEDTKRNLMLRWEVLTQDALLESVDAREADIFRLYLVEGRRIEDMARIFNETETMIRDTYERTLQKVLTTMGRGDEYASWPKWRLSEIERL